MRKSFSAIVAGACLSVQLFFACGTAVNEKKQPHQAAAAADSVPGNKIVNVYWPTALPVINKPLLFSRVPMLQNVSCDIDTNAAKITIYYNLLGAGNKPVTIDVSYSADNGRTYLGDFVKEGDNGTVRPQEKRRHITLSYNKTFHQATDIIRIAALVDDEPIWKKLADQVSIKRLKDDVQFIGMVRSYKTPEGVANLNRLKDTLETRWKCAGLQTCRQEFDWFGYKAHNMVGRKPGLTSEATTILVGGHFDSVKDSPGADDNGTGMATIMEVSRILSKYHLENSVKFLGFELEEEGLVGSQIYQKGKGWFSFEKPKEAIIIDMIGYTSDKENSQIFPQALQPFFPAAYKMVAENKFRGDFLISVANEKGAELGKIYEQAAGRADPGLKIASLVVKGKGEEMDELRRGDHSTFWDAGINALYLGDGADTRNPNYHKATDRSETINYKHLEKVTKATLIAVAKMAGLKNANVVYLVPGKFSHEKLAQTISRR
jgi:hypothetical protein